MSDRSGETPAAGCRSRTHCFGIVNTPLRARGWAKTPQLTNLRYIKQGAHQ